jgi:hypothetical protein
MEEQTTVPEYFVLQLAAELRPALIEDGPVESGFLSHLPSGCSTVPAADRDIWPTCKSSMITIAWFLVMVVEVLCRKSRPRCTTEHQSHLPAMP